MGSKKTPLILELRKAGGTLYVFPSASEDIGINLLSTTTGAALSHYALLNIPLLAIDNCISKCDHTIDINDNANLALSMSLLNYMMNFETLLTNQESYNYQALNTVTEKAFWHWANKIGMFDFSKLKKVDNSEYYRELGADHNKTTLDNTVIKCFGSIDAGNQLSTEFGMFNETYITIPTSWGAGPVYLQSSGDDNYKLEHIYTSDDKDYLLGRKDAYNYYTYTNGLDYPFFDSTSGGYKYETKGIGLDGFTIVKDVDKIQAAARLDYADDNILLNSHDDINIDIDNHFNIDEEFGFNAILLYYSVYDQDDLVKTAYATNLFGIIFLNGCELDSAKTKFTIPVLTKRKSTSEQFGNSFSFRVNLKTMSVYDNTDAIIQDNTTTSGVNAVEFSDAISNMNRAIDIMNSNLQTVIHIQDQYASIISNYNDFQTTIDDISTSLNSYLRGNRSAFINTSTLYVNEIHPLSNSSSNSIKITTKSGSVDLLGNPIYNEPAIEIADDKVNIPVLECDNLETGKHFVRIDNKSNYDLKVNGDDIQISDPFVAAALDTLSLMFSTYNDIVIKVKNAEELPNSLYIDPESPIFTNSMPSTSVKKFLNENGSINYEEFIPYIILELQRINMAMQN